jgi:putative oxidoreductase
MANGRPAGEIAEQVWTRVERLDARVLELLNRISLPLLRVSLGIVFVWFGALKVTGTTPVDDLVAGTVYWVDPAWFVPLLGAFEIAVGLGLLVGRALRLVLALFALQMLGTFGVLVLRPDVAFQAGNPLLLTVEGEFVIKNLVLLSAGLVVGSRLRRVRPWRAGADKR